MLTGPSCSLFTKIPLKYSTTYNVASLDSLLPPRKQHPSFFPVKIISHARESSFLLLLGGLRDRGEGKASEEVDTGRRHHVGHHQQERENVCLISRSLIRKDELSILPTVRYSKRNTQNCLVPRICGGLMGDGQGGLACCDSWGRKESDTTERLNWTELNGC